MVRDRGSPRVTCLLRRLLQSFGCYDLNHIHLDWKSTGVSDMGSWTTRKDGDFEQWGGRTFLVILGTVPLPYQDLSRPFLVRLFKLNVIYPVPLSDYQRLVFCDRTKLRPGVILDVPEVLTSNTMRGSGVEYNKFYFVMVWHFVFCSLYDCNFFELRSIWKTSVLLGKRSGKRQRMVVSDFTQRKKWYLVRWSLNVLQYSKLVSLNCFISPVTGWHVKEMCFNLLLHCINKVLFSRVKKKRRSVLRGSYRSIVTILHVDFTERTSWIFDVTTLKIP